MEFKLQIKSGRYDDTEVIRQINILRQIESTSSTPKKYAKLINYIDLLIYQLLIFTAWMEMLKIAILKKCFYEKVDSSYG